MLLAFAMLWGQYTIEADGLELGECNRGHYAVAERRIYLDSCVPPLGIFINGFEG